MAETSYHTAVPSTVDVAKFGQTLSSDGFTDASPKLAELVAFVREAQTGHNPQTPSIVEESTLTELLNHQAPDVVRYRAFAVLSTRWDRVVAGLAERRDTQFDEALQELLASWNHHQDLRKSSSEIQALFDSRQHLNDLRSEVTTRRKARV